jgi:hypothetical protein
VCIGLTNDRRPPHVAIRLVGHAFFVAVQLLAGGTDTAAVLGGQTFELLLACLRQGVIRGAHIGEHRAALFRRHFLRVQDGEQRQVVLVRGVGVPVGGALDAVPVDLAVLFDVGEPGDLRAIRMAVLDERMLARCAETAAERGKLGRAEVLVAEHQHRIFREGAHDPF